MDISIAALTDCNSFSLLIVKMEWAYWRKKLRYKRTQVSPGPCQGPDIPIKLPYLVELFSHFDLCIWQLFFMTKAKVINRNNTAGQLARLSQALSKRESISGCDPDEIYYQLNFYHFAVERQSGTGNCSPVTRKHYQKITTFRCKFWVVHDKHKRKYPQNHSAFVQLLSVLWCFSALFSNKCF